MDLSNQTIELNSNDDILANKTQEQIIKDHHKAGEITNAGWKTEDGEIIPRYQQNPRMGMTMEDEYTIDQWVKQMKRDFPNVDGAICDLIASHCYLHPESAKSFVNERTNNPRPDKDHAEYFKNIGLEKFE